MNRRGAEGAENAIADPARSALSAPLRLPLSVVLYFCGYLFLWFFFGSFLTLRSRVATNDKTPDPPFGGPGVFVLSSPQAAVALAASLGMLLPMVPMATTR